MSGILQDILDEKYSDLKEKIEEQVAKKLYNRIQEKKTKILADINGIPVDKMKEVIQNKGK